jgi:uncharacterized protein (DUF305 family)
VSPASTDADAAADANTDLADEVSDVGGNGHDDAGDDDWEGEPTPSGLSWGQALVFAAATAFLGFAVAFFLHRDQSPGADSVDVGFVQDMISHHEQALALSQYELANGSDPTVKSFAREVLIAQSMEIGSMDRLLDQWHTGRGSPSREAMAWMDMATPVDQMPGMATDDQVRALREATGAEADALFLELMAAHHVGGIHMAEYAAEHASTGKARLLAAGMAYNQAIEVNEYASTAERLGLPVEIETVDVPPAPTG